MYEKKHTSNKYKENIIHDEQKPMNKKIQGTNFRWVVPQLSAEIWSKKDQFKTNLLDKLLASKTAKKGIKYYSIAIESHSDGNPHLDMLIIFEKRIRVKPTELDFLCDKHGNLTRYRSINQAILEYGSKEDSPLTNIKDHHHVLNEQEIKKDPYVFLQTKMKEDPFTFNVEEYCVKNDILKDIKSWSAVKNKIKDAQKAYANILLRNKAGLKLITPQLIKETLTSEEFSKYLSWTGYCKLINYINQIYYYGHERPFKSKQVLLVGRPNTGKTSLNREIAKHVSTYELGVVKWWPNYRDKTYKFFSWNEFRLNVMPYTDLLKLLEGTVLNLEKKGDHVPRTDNQLIIMNSNVTYETHLTKKFRNWDDNTFYTAALENFPARVEQIIIPEGYDLFLLLKLIQPSE